MSKLILVRHGLSRWNLMNKFSGWVDMPLAPQGVEEAQHTAKSLSGVSIDAAFVSELSRAVETLLIILSKQDKIGIFQHKGAHDKSWRYRSNYFDETKEMPINESAALNERYYGQLQGMDKDKAREKFGEDQVLQWRRGFEARPPKGESLKDVYSRIVPYFNKKILEEVKTKNNVLVCAHGNSLRAIVKFLENISDQDIVNLEFLTGKALVYEYKRNKLRLVEDGLSFDRKVYWEAPNI